MAHFSLLILQLLRYFNLFHISGPYSLVNRYRGKCTVPVGFWGCRCGCNEWVKKRNSSDAKCANTNCNHEKEKHEYSDYAPAF